MKRKTTSMPDEPTKRLRLDHEPVNLVNFKSLREQAEPYRLGTAKFSIEALTSIWSLGSNRQIHENHIQSLCRIFEEQGLQREAAENHLLITCTQAEVQRMISRLDRIQQNTHGCERNPSSWPSFDDWMSVNGSKAEILAGQHRIEALKLYLRRISGRHQGANSFEKDESWWICDIYDKGENRRHGQSVARLNYHQIDFQHNSALGCVLTDRALYYQTAMDKSGWNWQHWRLQTLLCSKGQILKSRMRCFVC